MTRPCSHKLSLFGSWSILSRPRQLWFYVPQFKQNILKPLWTYGVHLWGFASNSNLEILERFQSKVLRIITDAPRYVPNVVIKRDLQVLSVGQEARNYSVTCRQRIDHHPNTLAKSLPQTTNSNRRLKRYYPADLATRFYEGNSISKLQIVIEKNRMEIMTYKQHLLFNIISIQI